MRNSANTPESVHFNAPVLNLSPWFEVRRDTDVGPLASVSATGDSAPWLGFFLGTVRVQAEEQLHTVDSLMAARDAMVGRLHAAGVRSVASHDRLFFSPRILGTIAG